MQKNIFTPKEFLQVNQHLRVHNLHQPYLNQPDQTALFYQEQTVSYGELEKNILKLATFLKNKGLQPQQRVALALPNSPAFIYSYLGISRAGGVVLPLHLQQTPQELLYILEDSEAAFLITNSAIAEKFDHISNFEILLVDSPWGLEEDFPLETNFPAGDLQEPATFLYTSGTTGKPKAAILSQANLLANVLSMHAVSNFDRSNNFLAVLPMFHSFGWSTCVLLPLFRGIAITILDGFRPKEMLKTLTRSENGITVFCGVPGMFHVLSRLPQKAHFPTLRYAFSGGDSISPQIIKVFKENYQFSIIEGYGLSEASPVVCLNPLDGIQKIKSVGLPMDGIEVKIVNEQGQDLPPGEIGEIIVQGDNVMQGYYHRPEDSAKALRDGWLYTGDLGYKDEDGYIFIAGRSKELIITSGFNVYPKEIEEILVTHPQISEAAVIGVPHPAKGEEIKAFLIPNNEEQIPDKKDLMNYLRQYLAAYKVPEQFVFAQDFPRGASGKILKRLLK